MNSVDGAPNATILAEGAPTSATATSSVTAKTKNSSAKPTTTAATTVRTKTTDSSTTTNTTSVIKPTDADATDEFHESDKNVRHVVVDEQQQQQPEQKQTRRNEAPIKQIIITKTIRATTAATATANGETATATTTMGNTNKTNIETTDKTTDAATTTATVTTIETTKSIQDAKNNDVPMTDMPNAEDNRDGNGDDEDDGGGGADDAGNDATSTSTTTTMAAVSTATAVIDNITTLAKPQPLLTAEGDNCELNELELCRCCGKPNVTLYDLFPNVPTDKANTILEGDTNLDAVAVNIKTTVDVNQATVCDIAANVAKNGAQINNNKTVVDTTSVATKTDDNAKTNTPKRCYRTIAASIAAAAASGSSTTTGSCSAGAPTCQKTNDPIVGTTINSDVVAGDRDAEVAPSTATTSAARVKQSATVAATANEKNVDDATNNAEAQNANAQAQNSDNMENILQEMQIWRLRIKSNDGLPQRICSKCTAQFYIIHKFRRKCLKVQIRLRSLFDKTNCWEYEELLAQVADEQTEELSTALASKTKSKPNNCQRLRNQETQTTDELETALSVNLPPVLDIGNDLINDNCSKSPRSGLELNVNAADTANTSHIGKMANNTASLSGNGNSSETSKLSSIEKTANAAATTATTTLTTVRTSSPCAMQNPLLGVEPTKPKTKVPNNDLTTLDVETALGRDVNRRSGRSVDQESLLATHIIFKPATAAERTKANKRTASPTNPTTVMMRTRSARKRPISCQQSNEDELSLAARVKDGARADDCLAAVNDVDDDDDDEVKNEALPRTDDAVPTDADQSVEAIAKTASLCASLSPSPTYLSGEPKHAENCVQREKRARERERERGGVCECVREGERETEAEIASAAVFMDTRHAHSYTATTKEAVETAAATAILCDADTLIARCGGDCGGNVVKAITDEPLTKISSSSRNNKVDDDVVDLLQPAVVVNTTKATPMDVDTSSVQQKPISGQAVTTTPTIGNNTETSATVSAAAVTVAVTAVVGLSKVPRNDVQSSKQTVEASEISNLPILPATTTNTTTCNNEAVKDGAAALQIIAIETDASKATSAAVGANNKGVAGNTLKSSLNRTLSLSNVQGGGCGVGGKHHLETDERLAAENVPVTVDADGNGDDEGVETLIATVEQQRPTTAEHKYNMETIRTAFSAETDLLETDQLETSTANDPNSASAVSAFITKAALKAYSTSPKCRSLARRHMQHKLRRTLKGPIGHLLANSPASTSAAAAAFTAMHYKKKQVRRSLTKLTSERATALLDGDAPAMTAATNDIDTNSIAEGADSTTLPTQPTFSYYATARRGRRRLKWRARSHHPCFDKHSCTESATTDCVVDVDKAESVTRLPSCFVRLRRLEATELYEEVTKSMTASAATVALQHTNEADVHIASLMDKKCVALKATDATEDASNTRSALKRKLATDENESTHSTRSPWRTKAEMKESLQEQTSMEDEEDQLVLPAQCEPIPFATPTEIQKTELYLTETAYSTDGDSTTTTAGGSCTERRSKRIKKRRKLLEETRRRVVTQGDNSTDGKVMPIILKLVQEKLPDACGSCATKQTDDKTSVTPSSQCALPRPLTAARYHVVGNLSKPQNIEISSTETQKRRRFRPKRSCCRDNCSLTDDAATTEDEHVPNVMQKSNNSTLPPPLISQNRGKMVINNVSILNVNGCAEATKENCDNNKKSVATSYTSGTSVGSSSGMTLPSQLVPLLPVLPALTPTQSEPKNTVEASTTDTPLISAVKLTPTKATPAASMSLKTFSTLMSNTTNASLFTSPVKTDIIESPTKFSTQSTPMMAKITALTSPTTTSTASSNPVSVLLRNQLIVRVPLSALSADFQKKFLKTTNVQKTPIKATLSDTSTVTTETSKISALTAKVTKSFQETKKTETAEIAHKKDEAREPAQAKENNSINSNKDGDAEGKCITIGSSEATADTSMKSTELPNATNEQPTNENQTMEVNSQPAQPQANATKAQFMSYSGYACGNSQYESEQSDFMGFSDGTGSSPNRRVECLTNNNALYSSCAVPTISTQTTASTDTLTDTKLHDFISEFAPEFADESEAPLANELQATLPAGEVTAALLAEAEAEAETVSTQQHTQLLSETNLSEMQDVETTLSGILNEMQDQHIYTPVSSSADDFFAQSVYSPLSEPPTTPTHSMYAESPLGGVGSVGSSSMAGGGGSLSVASSPYVQHMHMEPASVSSGQMSEPSPISAPMSVGPPTHQQQAAQQAQGAAAGYGKQYGNKYGECFTEDSTQSELIGFQNDIPCFENIELAGAAANNASASPASSQNEQSSHDLEMRALAAVSLEEATNCKVGVAKADTLQYMGTDMNACVNEANNGVQVHASATVCNENDGSTKEYSVDNAAFAQLLNDIQETERVVEQRARAQAQEDKAQDEVVHKKQHQRRQQHHTVPQPPSAAVQQHQHALQQQMLPAEGAQPQQLIEQQMAQQQQLPQAELLLQQQREEELLKQQQLLQQQQQQQEHLLQQKLLEQQQQEQLMQQQLLEQQRRHQQQQHQQQLLEQQRQRQRQQQQMLEQQRKQQQQQQQRPQIVHQTVLATPKQQQSQANAHTQNGQQQKQHYITLPPSCAYEAAQLQLAQAANAIQPIQNLGVGVNLYAHGLGSGQEIQWTSSADLTSLSPAIIEAPAAGGGTTTYYISASDLYQPNLIATTGMSPHLAGTAQQHGHHRQQQQHRHALELNKSSVVDANENYIEGAASTVQQRPACQQQPQQQQQIMIVIPQDYGKPGSSGATPQLYATTTGTPEPPTTYQLSQAPQTVIMQHAQPQMTGQSLPHMSTVQVNGINLSPQFIASPTVNSAQRTLHQTPPPRHMQHYQLHNATPPPHPASAQVANRPPRCASTPSASHYQQRQQHPQQQIQLQAVHTTPQVRMLQHTRTRQPAMQQLQLIQPHPQPQTAKPIATIAAKPSNAANAGTSSQKVNLVCRFCHKRPKFTSNLDYSNHIIAMHPVETPFNCPHCPMHFTRRVKRQQHIVEEHGAQRFQCAQCGQSFCTQRALDQHLQRAHALEPTQPLQTQAPKLSPSQSQAGGQQQRVSRQQTQNLATAQPTATHQLQHSPQRRKCFLQQRPTWLESRHRNAAMASAAAAAAASTNSQTSMVRVEDVHLQVCDDAAKGKKSIDLQLDTTQLSAESTTPTTHKPAGGMHTPSPSSSSGKPQRILCCPDCDDPFSEDHAHAQPCAAPQQQQQQELQAQMHHQQQQQQQQQQRHGEFLQQLEDESTFEEEEQQQSGEQSLQHCTKRAHVTMPSPEQTEPDSTSTNTATLRHFRKRRASAKLASMPALQAGGVGGGNTNAAAALMGGNANASEDELLLMERVLRNSHNCLFCDARFTNDIALRKHHQLAHSNQASMPFVCSICKRGFRMRSALQRHMETHDSEGRPYECTLCHVRFPRPSQLTLHKLTVHFLRKPHACEVCGKQFGTESALKTHSKFHAVRSFEFLQTLKYD
ncbi:serine-rich adhesin for platelets isoform X2 [Bactrocera oleae]|uniref:serine-rich adhesin for platelets isoform X2 n=1 Tax=Bactrocera oleae TaxID=104688 RepID=UPI00387ECE21